MERRTTTAMTRTSISPTQDSVCGSARCAGQAGQAGQLWETREAAEPAVETGPALLARQMAAELARGRTARQSPRIRRVSSRTLYQSALSPRRCRRRHCNRSEPNKVGSPPLALLRKTPDGNAKISVLLNEHASTSASGAASTSDAKPDVKGKRPTAASNAAATGDGVPTEYKLTMQNTASKNLYVFGEKIEDDLDTGEEGARKKRRGCPLSRTSCPLWSSLTQSGSDRRHIFAGHGRARMLFDSRYLDTGRLRRVRPHHAGTASESRRAETDAQAA